MHRGQFTVLDKEEHRGAQGTVLCACKCIDFWYNIFVEKEYLEVLTENRPKPLKKSSEM